MEIHKELRLQSGPSGDVKESLIDLDYAGYRSMRNSHVLGTPQTPPEILMRKSLVPTLLLTPLNPVNCCITYGR